MSLNRTRLGASIAALAAFSLTAGPAFAGHDWGDWGRHRHRDRIDAGDVLTGILIIGGIAAIASAASSSDRNRDRRRDDRRDRDDDYQRDADYRTDRAPGGQYASAPSWNEGGLAGAVDRCTNEISGAAGRGEVDAVSRADEGWRVQGRTGEGRGFSCTVDGSGRIRNISVDGESD